MVYQSVLKKIEEKKEHFLTSAILSGPFSGH